VTNYHDGGAVGLLLELHLVLVSHRDAASISVLRLLNWDPPPMLPEKG
jgi:hypothetical protein